MRLHTFKIRNCFGFRDTDDIDLSYPANLVYILGRNSSGKTALLTAVEALGAYETPDSYPRFENFDSTGQEPALIAQFDDIACATAGASSSKGFGLARLSSLVEAELKRENAANPTVVHSREFGELCAAIVRVVVDTYTPMFSAVEQARCVWVRRNCTGDYFTAADAQLTGASERLIALTQSIERAFTQSRGGLSGNDHVLTLDGSGHVVRLLTAQQIENLLWRQFPKIMRFDQRDTLSENLPDGILPSHLTAQSPLLSAFLDVLDRETARKALTTHNRVAREAFVREMQVRVDAVTAEVNEIARGFQRGELMHIELANFGEGLQVTVTVGNERPSYYRHISDNTKLLFAYYLLQKAKHITADILLFDEPNNGFHASAQEELLRFLKELAADGKQVIVSTHSEHLIDLDHLAGVRRMVTDARGNYLGVRNKWNAGTQTEGDVMALRPVMDAIGLRFGASPLTFRDHLIVVEGASELYYLRALRQIFGGDELHLVPANGDEAMKPVIALIVGQRLHFKVVVDTKRHGKSAKERLQEAYAIPSGSIYEIAILLAFRDATPGSGIEDLFSKSDFGRILAHVGNPPMSEFDTMANSAYMNMKNVGRVPKLVVARWFSKNAGQFVPSGFDSATQANTHGLLRFCSDAPWFKM